MEEDLNEITNLEKTLPTPHTFKSLISIYRELGKSAEKDNDLDKARMYFDRMLSLSKLWHRFYGFKKTGIKGRDVNKAEIELSEILVKHNTYYPYTYKKQGPVANDVLLSTTDYKHLAKLNENDTIPKPKTSSKPLIKHEIEADIPVAWMPGKIIGKQKTKLAYLGKHGQPLSIENYVLESYLEEGFEGYWTENEYWWAILGLLFWDVIFADVPGAFQFGKILPGQDMPSDLFSGASFYLKRKKLINKRIKELTETSLFGFILPNIERELLKSYQNHYYEPCRLIVWDKYPEITPLLLAVRNLSGRELMGIMEHMLLNFNHNRSGLPDLFVTKEGEATFVEVKSEKEPVANHQYVWLRHLREELGINAGICRVFEEVE